MGILKIIGGIVTVILLFGVYVAVKSYYVPYPSGLVGFSDPDEFREYFTEQAPYVLYTTAAEMRAAAEKYSKTNVQVEGIDEPDVIKTDGKRIYYSRGRTFVIDAYPPSELGLNTTINDYGKLFIQGDTVVIISSGSVKGYVNAEKIWDLKLPGYFLDARLSRGKIYIATFSSPEKCPIDLGGYQIACSEILHPIERIPADGVITILKIDATTGKLEKKTGFTVLYGSSAIYMTENSIYLVYPVKILRSADFSVIKDIVMELDISPVIKKKIADLEKLNLTEAEKIYRAGEIITSSLDESELKRLEPQVKEIVRKKMREWIKSNVVKLDTDLNVRAIGEVPGVILNQFSMDEYNGFLRIGTTISFQGESVNDVYVLDRNLNIIGSVKDLGISERIYAVRFLGDRGYVVTFRQTDPFYVIDLSDPRNPKLAGELKIPGFSSYLHPLPDHRILGIGMESGNLKLSLFDVSDPSNPVEVKKQLIEGWSEVLYTHRAFVYDPENAVFFIPVGSRVYVFSYDLEEVAVLEARDSPSRAVYIENYAYVVSPTGVNVYSMENWEKITNLTLPGVAYPRYVSRLQE
ncbi:MAG: hypothetical protein GXO63_02000 [Candidatus Micrarchaeota archaeon]|nr:hypothetical protein [Candidatus Micrarchaeota archaeon]